MSGAVSEMGREAMQFGYDHGYRNGKLEGFIAGRKLPDADMAELALFRALEKTPRELLDILKQFVFPADAAAGEDSE